MDAREGGNNVVAGNWVMVAAQEEPRAIAASRGAVVGAPDGFPEVVVCDSAEALGVLLAGGIEAWGEYRDRVVGR